MLVESLLARRAHGDLEEAQATVDRSADASVDPGYVLDEVTLLRLRGLLGQAHSDTVAHQQFTAR